MVNFITQYVPVVILAGGRATRMEPLATIYPKALMPIAGKPLIERIFMSFKLEGFRNFIIVCSPEANELKDYVNSVSQNELDVKYKIIEQNEPKGMVDAIQCAKNSIKELLLESSHIFQERNLFPFYVLTAVDVLLDQTDLSEFIKTHINFNPSCSLAVYKSEDGAMSETHGNVKLQENIVVDIIEKPGPDKKIDDFYSIPLYTFTLKMLEILDKVKISIRNELELPSAIKLMLESKHTVLASHLCRKKKIDKEIAGMYHLTYIKDLLKFSSRFLKDEPFEYTGEYPTLIEPAAAMSCEIGDSVLIGPNVYIAEGCEIGDYSEISQSILLGNNKIGKNVQIENSIIGTNVEIPNGRIIKDSLMLENNDSHKI